MKRLLFIMSVALFVTAAKAQEKPRRALFTEFAGASGLVGVSFDFATLSRATIGVIVWAYRIIWVWEHLPRTNQVFFTQVLPYLWPAIILLDEAIIV